MGNESFAAKNNSRANDNTNNNTTPKDNTTPTSNAKMDSQKRTYEEAFPEVPIIQNLSSPRMQPSSQNRQDRLPRPIARQFNVAEAQRSIGQLKQDLQREADMIDQLEASQLDLGREKREQQRRAVIAEARVDALGQQVQNLERGLRLANDQNRGLKLMVSDQAQQIADQQIQIYQQQAIERQMEPSTNSEWIRLRERDHRHFEYEGFLVTDLDTAKELITHLTRSVKEKEDQFKAMELLNEEWGKSRDGFHFDNQLLQAKVQAMEQALKESYANFSEYNADCEHEFELAEQAKADQAEVISTLADEKVLLQAQIEGMQQKLQEADDKFKDYNADCKNEFRLAEQAKTDQAEVINTLAGDKSVLQAQLQYLQRQNNNLASTNDRFNADWREELELLEGQKQDQRDVINSLMDDKAVLTAQVKEIRESERKAWELVRKKAALRRSENRGWLAEAERADEYSAGLEEEIKKWQRASAEMKEKIDKLASEKLGVYDAWREEVKYLNEKIEEGEDANIDLRDQIGILEQEVQEMIAQRMVSDNDNDNQGKNASESVSNPTLRDSSPAFEGPGSPIYDFPGWNPSIDASEHDQPQSESGVFIHDDNHAAIEHHLEHNSDNDDSSGNSNSDVTKDIKERPSWGGPWEKATGKRGREEEDAEVESWVEKAERLSQPERKRRRLQTEVDR